MSNPDYINVSPRDKHKVSGHREKRGTKAKKKLNFSSANWPSPPKGRGPDRSAGFKKIKPTTKDEGI